MNNWPSEHRLALALFLALLAAAGVAFFVVIRPEARDVSKARDAHDDLDQTLKDKVKDTGYPLDATRLKAHVASRKALLEGLEKERADGTKYNTGLIARATRVLEHATGMFTKQIEDEYTDVATFKQVSSIVYKDELDQLTQELSRKNIFLVEEVLGLGEDTTDVETYELLLKVWTIKRIVKVLKDDNGLFIQNRRLARKPGEKGVRTPLGMMGGRGRTASEITVLPTRSYVLHESDDESYVLEFPIRIRFQGPLPTICEAIQGMQTGENFLTVNRFILESEDPNLMASRKPGSDGMVRSRNVIVTLEVSSYFRPSGHSPAIRASQNQPLPPGA